MTNERYIHYQLENVCSFFIRLRAIYAREKQGHNNERLKFDDDKKMNFFFSADMMEINFRSYI